MAGSGAVYISEPILMCDEEDIELEGELTSDTTFDFSSEWDNREIFGDCDTGSVVDSCSIRFRGQGWG